MIKEALSDMGCSELSNEALDLICKESGGCVETAVDLYLNDSSRFDSIGSTIYSQAEMNASDECCAIEECDDLEITSHVARRSDADMLRGRKEPPLTFPIKIGEIVLVVQSTFRESGLNLDGKSIELYVPDPVKLAKKVKNSFHGQRVAQGIVRVKIVEPVYTKPFYWFDHDFKPELFADRDIAKLDPATAQFIEKLMEMDICTFKGVVVSAPSNIKLLDEIIVSVDVSLTPNAFFRDNDNVESNKLRMKFEMNEANVNDRRSALIHLFRKLNFAFKSRMVSDVSPDNTVKSEEEHDLTGGQLMSIYNKTKNFESTYAAMKPSKGFLFTLKPYQETALGFLTMKEASRVEYADLHALSPLFEEFRVPGTRSAIYFSPFNGTLTMTRPIQEHCKCGILADEMGLGKTIEILSLIHTNRFDVSTAKTEKSIGSTLIICPLNVLDQWKNEAMACIDDEGSFVEIYYGDRDANRSFIDKSPLIVLSTYQTLASEFKTKEFASALYQPHWHRIAHYIKDRSSSIARACFALNANSRWAVTGTPIINKLEDLFSLIKFLHVEPWNNVAYWKTFISDPFARKDVNVIKLAQSIMEPIILRRTKDMKCENGEPIVSLKKKQVDIVYLSLKHDEQDIYDKLLARSKLKLHMLKGAGKLDYTRVFTLILRLRQICDHQSLLPKAGDDDDEIAVTDLDGLVAGKNTYSEKVRDEIIAKTASECPLCLETLTGCVVLKCLHRVCEECIQDYLGHLEAKGEPGVCPICRAPCLAKDVHRVCEETSSDNITLVPITFNTSTKLNAIMSRLKEIRDEAVNHKTIVFSQWTSMLDVVQIPLKVNGFNCVRLDGSMSQSKRASTINRFREDASITVLLASLKSCGVGLNLTMASRAILIDPWWNSSVEEQAIDRIHRIGQDKDVEITRFIVSNSIEEKMLAIQKRKSGIAGFITSPEDTKITMDDLMALLD